MWEGLVQRRECQREIVESGRQCSEEMLQGGIELTSVIYFNLIFSLQTEFRHRLGFSFFYSVEVM